MSGRDNFLIDRLEQRVHLSATVEYHAQRADGSLEPPIEVTVGGNVEDFSPQDTSILQQGFTSAQHDLFLKLSNIQGESTDDAHAGEIELLSFSWGADATHSSGERTSIERTGFQELHVVSRVSSASPHLLHAMAQGTPIAEASLFVRKAGERPKDFLRVDLRHVLVSSYQVRPDASGALVEEVTLSFGDGAMEYHPLNNDGTLGAPVRFAARAPVTEFAPVQRSLLQEGWQEPAGLSQFLTLDGIVGESRVKERQDAIDVRSFSWGGDLAIEHLSGEVATSRPSFHELHVVARVSKASPKIMQAMTSGTIIPTAMLAVTRPNSSGDFYRLTLGGAVVSSYQLTTSADGELLEEFTLNFAAAEVEYRAQKLDGSLAAPVVFQAAQVDVHDFAPKQKPLLHDAARSSGSLQLFLDIPGIEGESAAKGHENEIELLSFSWGGDAAMDSRSGGSGNRSLHEIRFVSAVSKASPVLMQRLTTGMLSAAGTLVVRRQVADSAIEFFKISLQDLIVSSYQLTTAHDERLLEEVSLSFDAIEVEYRTQRPDGSLDAPVLFQSASTPVENYAAKQRSLLQEGYALSSGLDSFLRLDGILGESNAVGHEQIDLHAFEWGADVPVAGKPLFHELHVTSPISRASPKLMEAMTTRTPIATGDLFLRRATDSQAEFFKVNLKDLLVSSYQVKPGIGGALVEEYTLSFREVRIEYRPQHADGKLGASVVFQEALAAVEDFEPAQRALIDRAVDVAPQVDLFLEIGEIEGESRAKGHEGQIDVLSFSWGGDSATSSSTGLPLSKPELRELHLVSKVSKASPQLIEAMTRSRFLSEAALSFVLRGGDWAAEFMRIDLRDVLVSSYQTTTANDGTLMEEVTLSFEAAEWDYRRVRADGSLDAPVTFAARQLPVEDFRPVQRPILRGATLASGLEAFIEIEGIPGESQDKVHADEIDVLSFGWGGDAIIDSMTGGGAHRARLHELHVLARSSVATPLLLSALMNGKNIPDATLTLRNPVTQAEFFTIKLANVIVGSHRVTTAVDGTLLEEVTLAYAPDGAPEPPTAVTLTGTAGADAFYLRRNGTNIDVFTDSTGGGNAVQVIPGGTGIVVETLGGDDLLVIDQIAGDVVAPGGLTFSGGDGSDTLRILNATGDAVINQLGVTTVGATQVDHGGIENLELAGILIGLLLPANQLLKVAGDDGQMTVQDLEMGDGARLDLGTNDLKILNATAADVEPLLATARNVATRWAGPGIGTSAAGQHTGLAPMQQGTDVLVKFTYNGDANGDGRVNADDYFRIDSGFLAQPPSPLYAQGDFNFDGKVNADDYFLIDSAFLGQGAPAAASEILAAAAPASAAVITPEEPKKPARRTVRDSIFSTAPVRQATRRVR